MNETIITKNRDFQNYLNGKSKWNDIAAIVAQEALATESAKAFFEDLSQYGCMSGMVGSLIYYRDTHKFFDTHYAEIEDMRDGWKDSVWEELQISGDLKNYFAWFAFEEVAYRIASDWELV